MQRSSVRRYMSLHQRSYLLRHHQMHVERNPPGLLSCSKHRQAYHLSHRRVLTTPVHTIAADSTCIEQQPKSKAGPAMPAKACPCKARLSCTHPSCPCTKSSSLKCQYNMHFVLCNSMLCNESGQFHMLQSRCGMQACANTCSLQSHQKPYAHRHPRSRPGTGEAGLQAQAQLDSRCVAPAKHVPLSAALKPCQGCRACWLWTSSQSPGCRAITRGTQLRRQTEQQHVELVSSGEPPSIAHNASDTR